MKIQGRRPPDGHEISLNIQRSRNVSGTEAKGQVNEPQRQRQSDRIDISQRGKEVAAIIASLNSLPDIREEKVQALKEAIDKGTYKIDPVKIAEKMLSEI